LSVQKAVGLAVMVNSTISYIQSYMTSSHIVV